MHAGRQAGDRRHAGRQQAGRWQASGRQAGQQAGRQQASGRLQAGSSGDCINRTGQGTEEAVVCPSPLHNVICHGGHCRYARTDIPFLRWPAGTAGLRSPMASLTSLYHVATIVAE